MLWWVVRTSEVDPDPGEQATRKWLVELERPGATATVAVIQVAATSAHPDARQAVATNGRSALRRFQDQEQLPARITLTESGVAAA